MMVAVDLVHSETLISADRAGLSAKTVTLDGMAVRLTLSTEDFEIYLLGKCEAFSMLVLVVPEYWWFPSSWAKSSDQVIGSGHSG